MAEIRVQCTKCQSKMKLTASIEKVRCPKCETLFSAAQNRVSSGSSRKKSSPSRKQAAPKQAASSSFNFDDDFEDDNNDLFGSSSSPRKKSRSKPAPKTKSRRRKEPKPGALSPEQIRKFGFTLMMFGVGAFVLPLIGLQVKGLHKLGPEAQALGGVCLLLCGGVVVLISFKDSFGDVFSQLFDRGFSIVKWGAIGLLVLLFGGSFFLFGLNKVINSLKSVGGDHEQVVHEIPQPPRHTNIVPPNNPFRNSGGFRSPSQRAGNFSTNPSETNGTSPFIDAGSENRSSQSAATSSPMRNPSVFPGSGSGNSSSTGKSAVKVVMKGFSRRDATRHFRDLRVAGETNRMRIIKIGEDTVELEFTQAADAQTFADQIKFGTVTNVDTDNKVITVEQ